MKILLTFPDIGKDCEEIIMEWLRSHRDDRNPKTATVMKFCEKIEVVKESAA